MAKKTNAEIGMIITKKALKYKKDLYSGLIVLKGGKLSSVLLQPNNTNHKSKSPQENNKDGYQTYP